MIRFIIRAAKMLAILSILLAGTIFTWSRASIKVDRTVQDPATALLAERAKEGISYAEHYFEFKGQNLHYIISEPASGAEETIIFLHGFPSFWLSFVRQIEQFNTEYRVIAIDGLGAGKSDAPSDVSAYEFEAMSAHLLALLEHEDIDRIHLVGHDWGASLAVSFSQAHPERVQSVTGIAAPALNAMLHGLEKDPKAQETAAYVETFKRANPPLLVLLGTAGDIYDGAYKPLVEAGALSQAEANRFSAATRDPKRTNAHINWYRANLPHPDALSDADFWPSREARISVPALYIWGENDPIYNQTAMARQEALSDNAKTLIIPENGHWPHVRSANEVNAALMAHITTSSPEPNRPKHRR